jgi:hypothetical protein
MNEWLIYPVVLEAGVLVIGVLLVMVRRCWGLDVGCCFHLMSLHYHYHLTLKSCWSFLYIYIITHVVVTACCCYLYRL